MSASSLPPTVPSGVPILDARCWNHESREAVGRCPECHRYFCRECVTEHEGRIICAGCVARLSGAGTDEKRTASVFWIAYAIGGLILAWLVFYYVGAGLASTPSLFHGGPA